MRHYLTISYAQGNYINSYTTITKLLIFSLISSVTSTTMTTTTTTIRATSVGDDQVCKTISGPTPNQECKFPFSFEGKKYDTCMEKKMYGRKRKRPLCPTELDKSGSFMRGKWGFCDISKCPLGK